MSSSSGQDVIVMFKETASRAEKDSVLEALKQAGNEVKCELEIINGASVRLKEAQSGFAGLTDQHPSIEHIEIDGTVSTQDK
ncbi:hypothetical protein IWQ56_003724 [Coemansia nantahalensis]|uniref:Uncharacterized protein n=2 Tax=Coemansia TaxID=4863 RepID=A0ACC1L6A6_9FUNG|nr:hypothetical protein IWQ57_004497 [Coemansia nantahalensis]KAJ2766444.1 hypothetical protein IWQ56_003724 [Coemansia nantahalensis]KAJ2801730.1 hypothetical protein H4R21_002688 [Coemansia helicoidea]